jgi:signal transduction histidine kinase
VYAFDPDTAIFAALYLLPMVAAYRYGMRGAMVTMGVAAACYLVRDLWAAQHFGTDFLVVSVTFRMGIGFIIAAIAGAMADRYEDEHRVVLDSLVREQRAGAALRSLDQLRSTFLAAVSHELRTPLTSILGFSMTIQERAGELSPSTRVMLDQIVTESRHLERLLQDLLDIERMGRGSIAVEREEVDVAGLVRRVARRIEQRAGRSVVADADPCVGVVDAAKVERIVDNLLANAAKYSPDDRPIEVHVERSADGLVVVVEDHGSGVPEALRRTIFAPFERGTVTSTHQPGTGIGLSLVDRFARVHGGRAWVEDRETGSGASFRVYLPDGPAGTTLVTVMNEPWGHADLAPDHPARRRRGRRRADA